MVKIGSAAPTKGSVQGPWTHLVQLPSVRQLGNVACRLTFWSGLNKKLDRCMMSRWPKGPYEMCAVLTHRPLPLPHRSSTPHRSVTHTPLSSIGLTRLTDWLRTPSHRPVPRAHPSHRSVSRVTRLTDRSTRLTDRSPIGCPRFTDPTSTKPIDRLCPPSIGLRLTDRLTDRSPIDRPPCAQCRYVRVGQPRQR